MASSAKAKNEKQSLCFVVGPIGKEGTSERRHADLLLNAVIKQVLQDERFGYLVKRADEDADPGMIGDRVITDIINADLVVADLTDLNPNAFYELGIRHSTEKPTIHLARAGTVLPFDNVSHRTIFVDLTDWNSIESARERLANSATAISSSDYKVSNPITQANASFKMRQSEDPRDQIIAEMQERMASLENAISLANATVGQLKWNKGLIDTLASALKSGRKLEGIKAYREAFPNTSLEHAVQFLDCLLAKKTAQAVKTHHEATGCRIEEAIRFVRPIVEKAAA